MQIHYAAKRGDQGAVARHLDQGVSVDAPDEDWGGTPLMWAASSPKADVKMLSYLVSRGANVNAVGGSYGTTAFALSCGSLEKLNYLLSVGADPFLTKGGKAKAMPFTYSLEAIDKLLTMGFDPSIGGSDINPSILEDFSRDCRWEHIKLCAKYDINLLSLDWTPLMTAIVLADDNAVANHLRHGADITSTDIWARTPLLLAICSGSVEKAQLLLDAGASLKECGRGGTSNYEFVEKVAAEMFKDDFAGVETLMAAAKTLDMQPRAGESCLDCAILSGSPKMLEWILDAGIDPNLKGLGGDSPLMAASQANADFAIPILLKHGSSLDAEPDVDRHCINVTTSASTLKLLSEAGADINHVDGTGSFPLRFAAEEGNVEAVACLIKLGADVNVNPYRTALHEAAIGDEIEIMKLLLRAGANPNIAEKDRDARTPLHCVKTDDARQVLLDAGADPSL